MGTGEETRLTQEVTNQPNFTQIPRNLWSGYHDPREVAPENFRFDLGLSIPNTLQGIETVNTTVIPAGRDAVSVHRGPRDNIICVLQEDSFLLEKMSLWNK